jgi:hypothetical protein
MSGIRGKNRHRAFDHWSEFFGKRYRSSQGLPVTGFETSTTADTRTRRTAHSVGRFRVRWLTLDNKADRITRAFARDLVVNERMSESFIEPAAKKNGPEASVYEYSA